MFASHQIKIFCKYRVQYGAIKINIVRIAIHSRWSIIEIETSSKYPDVVQAYAAGLLEGSLTWQLIYHHWHNTVKAVCEDWALECWKLMEFFRANTAIVRERAERLAATDSFWHMVN